MTLDTGIRWSEESDSDSLAVADISDIYEKRKETNASNINEDSMLGALHNDRGINKHGDDNNIENGNEDDCHDAWNGEWKLNPSYARAKSSAAHDTSTENKFKSSKEYKDSNKWDKQAGYNSKWRTPEQSANYDHSSTDQLQQHTAANQYVQFDNCRAYNLPTFVWDRLLPKLPPAEWNLYSENPIVSAKSWEEISKIRNQKQICIKFCDPQGRVEIPDECYDQVSGAIKTAPGGKMSL